jgi:hypothetical protein
MEIALAVVAALSIPFAVIAFVFFHDRWMHEGVTVFKRRGVLRSGTAAPARVLSTEALPKSYGRGSGATGAYSIVYEVLPPGAAPFRAKGVEVMTFVEEDANLSAARQPAQGGTGATVQVKFDPQSHLVVLVRVDAKKWERERAAAKQEAQNALLRQRPSG